MCGGNDIFLSIALWSGVRCVRCWRYTVATIDIDSGFKRLWRMNMKRRENWMRLIRHMPTGWESFQDQKQITYTFIHFRSSCFDWIWFPSTFLYIDYIFLLNVIRNISIFRDVQRSLHIDNIEINSNFLLIFLLFPLIFICRLPIIHVRHC